MVSLLHGRLKPRPYRSSVSSVKASTLRNFKQDFQVEILVLIDLQAVSFPRVHVNGDSSRPSHRFRCCTIFPTIGPPSEWRPSVFYSSRCSASRPTSLPRKMRNYKRPVAVRAVPPYRTALNFRFECDKIKEVDEWDARRPGGGPLGVGHRHRYPPGLPD